MTRTVPRTWTAHWRYMYMDGMRASSTVYVSFENLSRQQPKTPKPVYPTHSNLWKKQAR